MSKNQRKKEISMKALLTLQGKIEELQRQKEHLIQKEAADLFTQIMDILKEDFSPKLVLNILNDAWKNASPQQLETWKYSVSNPNKNKIVKNKSPEI
jgi:hypothetical protein